MRRAFMVVAGLLVSSTTAMAWSWTGDEAGQKLDREARRWLTTQNICGVQLKSDYIKDLDARIVAHFTTMADGYREFLLSSVGSANAEYLQQAKPAEVKKVCEERGGEAAKAGVLADFNPVPYRWGAVPQPATSGNAGPTPAAT